MHLIIDSGNTLTKAAVYNGTDLVTLISTDLLTNNIINNLLRQFPCTHAIICDVSGGTFVYQDELQNKLPTIIMDHLTPTPLINLYQSPESLGPDRIAAAVCGASMFPAKNVLVVQAGTCITYEMVSKNNEYLGGSIAPGIDMRLKALNTFTSKLPLVRKTEPVDLTGNNTTNAILSGVLLGCRAETDGMIDKYKENFTDLMVVLGGGDRFFFDKTLKNRIFAVANVVLRGLNLILEYNK